jgi:hypothetical protein
MIKGLSVREKPLILRIRRSSPRNAETILRDTTSLYRKIREIISKRAEKESCYNPENETKKVP